MNHSKTFRGRAGLVITLTILMLPSAVLSARAGGKQVKAAGTSPLATAKTVQVVQELFRADRSGQLQHVLDITVKVAGPNKIWAEQTSLKPARDGKPVPPSVFVMNGKTVYEYMGGTNQFTKIEAPASGKTPETPSAMYYGVSAPLLTGVAWTPPGFEIAVPDTTETLDGKAMRVTAHSTKPREGRALTMKLWTDAQTGLPYRQSIFMTDGDKTTEARRTNFTHWTLNKPLAPAVFAWTPPAAARPYKEETPESKLLAAGTTANDFSAVAPDGHTVKLSDYRGKVVVLDFWATWCGPCQKSMPHLEKVYQQIKDQNVAVLALCVWDEKPKYDAWLVEKKGVYSFLTAFDPAGSDNDKSIASTLFNVSGIPTTYVLDKEGKVVATLVGFDEGDTRLEDALTKAGIAVHAEKKGDTSR